MNARERQVQRELRRMECVERGGHRHVTDNMTPGSCVHCGEPYPVVVDQRRPGDYGGPAVLTQDSSGTWTDMNATRFEMRFGLSNASFGRITGLDS